MKWYVDDLLVFEMNQTGLSTKTNPSNSAETTGQRNIPLEPMYITLGVSSPDPSDVTLPAEMGVDYVRLYQGAGQTLTCDPTLYATSQYVAANQVILGVPTCGNGVCDAGECEQCPTDCLNTIACKRDCLVPQCQTRDPTFLAASEWAFEVCFAQPQSALRPSIAPSDLSSRRPIPSHSSVFYIATRGSERGGGWHKAWVLGCLPFAAPVGLSSLLILTLRGSQRVLVVSTVPLDDVSCLTTPGSAVPETGCCPCR